jgi:hypothetical protein
MNGIVCPQVAEGGDGLQIWRIVVRILNKQSGATNKGWSSALGVGRGANNSSPSKIIVIQNVTKGLGPGWILWINDLKTKLN